MASNPNAIRRPHRWVLWLPGIGVKRATELLDRNENKWEAVCKAFTDRGLSDDDALLNARLAKILRQEDYDLTNSQPILWNPKL